MPEDGLVDLRRCELTRSHSNGMTIDGNIERKTQKGTPQSWTTTTQRRMHQNRL